MMKLVLDLASKTGLYPDEIEEIVATAPFRYKTYNIRKRNGGLREISQPSFALKIVQRGLVDILLTDCPVHGAATAYLPGKSIIDNALPHTNSGAILKMDFKDFFTSIRAADWRKYCHENMILDPKEIEFTTKILFRNTPRKGLRLAIGAPSSPILSNILLYRFDEIVCSQLSSEKVCYTRYADDMTFSAKRTGFLHDVRPAIKEALGAAGVPKLAINEEKTVVATKKYSRRVTGLVLTNDGAVSLGKSKKRLLRAAVHNYYTKGSNSLKEVEKLMGHLNFLRQVEPDYYKNLTSKYSTNAIEDMKNKIAVLAKQSTLHIDR